MLRVKKLILNDFGPYKGRQEIMFPEGDGVVVFFGENGRGKTSLLNAIRFVLFDRIIGRGSRSMDFKNILNWEALQEGKSEFSVEMQFLFDNEEFHLTRLRNVNPGNEKTETFLRKKGVSLPVDVAQKTIAKMMPEQVSRFFLFDGELLQEYEELLLETTQSVGIKESIERILGVPILTNSIAHLNEGHREAKKSEARALESVSKTKHIGEALKSHQEFEAALEIDLKIIEKDLVQHKNEKLVCESVMRQNEESNKLLVKKSGILDEIKETKHELQKLEDDVSSRSRNLWLIPIRNKLKDHLQTLSYEQDKMLQNFGNRITSSLLLKSSQEGICAICSSTLSDEKRNEMASAGSVQQEVGSGFEGLQSLSTRVQKLQEVISKSDTDLVQHLFAQVKQKKMKIQEKEMAVVDLEKQLLGVDEKELLGVKGRFERTLKEIAALEAQLVTVTASLAQKRSEIAETHRSLSKVSDQGSTKDTLRRQTYEQLLEIFTKGLGHYRDRLKHFVEKEASSLFAKFSSDKDYEKLSINSNYGLTIVHKDGSEIPVRSAGFEHIVALSLMGSLQKNAPLRGPIFMDSPMGRLDRNHKINVTKGLPVLSAQVALLVYEDEISQDEVADILGTKLLKRYHLRRITARHTIIEER